MSKPRALSLFSGIGLHDLGLERAGWEIAGQVELDPWCRAVLAKHWPLVPRWEDIRNVTASDLSGLGRIDLVSGGFPCPDISCTGKGVGLLRGGRSSLWVEMARIIRECRPAWVLAENVPALRLRGIDSVLADLEAAGYAAWPVVVGAWALGAPHRRDRVWIIGQRVAHGARDGQLRQPQAERTNGQRVGAGSDCGMGNAAGPQREEGLSREEFAGEGGSSQGRIREPGGSGIGGLANPNGGALRLESGRINGEEWPEAPEPGIACKGMAHCDGAGLEIHEGEPGYAWEEFPPSFGSGGAGLANAEGGGRAPEGECSPQPEESRFGRLGARWPARRGEPQHEWEPPRLVKSGLGGGANGRASRLDGFRRRNRLKALGNANPPQVPEIIGRWMIAEWIGRQDLQALGR